MKFICKMDKERIEDLLQNSVFNTLSEEKEVDFNTYRLLSYFAVALLISDEKDMKQFLSQKIDAILDKKISGGGGTMS